MEYTALRTEKKDQVGIITMDVPRTLNAIDYAGVVELQEAMESMIADKEVRVIVITGAGNKSFISGGDIAVELAMDAMASYEWSLMGHKLASTIEESPKPVIAAVNGYCLGGGCEIAIACDMRIASHNAKFGVPEMKLGVMCGFGGNIRLPRLVGKTKASEMLLTGNMIDAHEAYRIGLVNNVVPQEDLMETVMKLAADITCKSAIALNFSKKAIQYGLETDIRTAIQHEAELFGLVSGTYDKKEGMNAFIEKRTPKFEDR